MYSIGTITVTMMPCVNCLQGMPEYCSEGGCDVTAGINADSNAQTQDVYWRKPNRHKKRRAVLKDPLSTGRKEAARLYKIDRTLDCEWGGKFSVGGGLHPINGCGTPGRPPTQKQRVRHHGPDKTTTNNAEGNVHRICDYCHNMWHAKNDADYIPGEPVKGD
jgi:hypothetical protein